MRIPQNTAMRNRSKSAKAAAARYRRRVERADMADYKEEIERLLRRAPDEARNPIDFDALDRGNR